MSIFQEQIKSDTEKRYERINEMTLSILKGEVSRCKGLFEAFWGSVESPISKEDASALLEMLGTEAKPAFQFHGAWQQLIKSALPSYEVLIPPYPIAFNEDGSAYINDEN